MKKTTLLLTTVAAIFVFTCTGCAGNKEKTPENPDTTYVSDELDISVFTEVETSSENISVYRKEVAKRLDSIEEGEDFITDEEWEAISSNWDMSQNVYRHQSYFTTFDKLYEETTKYYYPVVFREGNSLVMWYTSDTGSVLLKGVYGDWNGSNYVGHIHTDSEDKVMASEVNYSITYNQETGKVTVWRFGESSTTYDVTSGSEYCGFSDFEGYIFRSGTDVYALKAEGTYNNDGELVCIAHNVKYVIDADYYYGSDPWCQPLFQMTDGSVKAYIGWNGNQASPDDESHLAELQYEGSWDK